MSDTNKKARFWTFVAYPGEGDTLPKDWKTIINKMGIEWCHSPLHDQDINDDGEPKKPHYHVLLAFGNTTTFNSVKDITDALNCPIPQIVKNPKGMLRYFMHLDNPEKHQYCKDEIQAFNGFDYEDFLKLSVTQEEHMYFEIVEFIESNMIKSYFDLVKITYNLNFDWFRLVRRNSYFFTAIIKDLKYYNK